MVPGAGEGRLLCTGLQAVEGAPEAVPASGSKGLGTPEALWLPLGSFPGQSAAFGPSEAPGV